MANTSETDELHYRERADALIQALTVRIGTSEVSAFIPLTVDGEEGYYPAHEVAENPVLREQHTQNLTRQIVETQQELTAWDGFEAATKR